MRNLIFILVGSAVLCACATTMKFDDTPLDGIRNGVTTEDQLRELIGPPHHQETGVESGSQVFVYEEVKASKVGSDRKVSGYTGTMSAPKRKIERTLTVQLNADGIVTDWEMEQRTIRPDYR